VAAEDIMNQHLRQMSENLTNLTQFLRESNGGNGPSAGPDSQSSQNRKQIESAAKAQTILLNSTNALTRSFADSVKLNGESNKMLTNSVQENIDTFARLESSVVDAESETKALAELYALTGIKLDSMNITVDAFAEASRDVADAQADVMKASRGVSGALAQMKKNLMDEARVGAVIGAVGGKHLM